MKLRNSPCILRIHSSKKKKEEEGIYAELLLYFPWRSEKKLRENFIDKFNENYEIIKRNKEMIYPNSKMIEDMRELLDSNEDIRPKHLYENLDPAGNQDNLDNEEMIEPMDTSALPEEDPVPVNSKSSGLLFKRIEVDEHDVMLQMARSLSLEQRIVFDQILQFCKTVLRSKNGATDDLFPPNIIVTGKNKKFSFGFLLHVMHINTLLGGGGAGKSYLIRTISKWTEKILEKCGPYRPKVLLLAYTGAASSLIGNES